MTAVRRAHAILLAASFSASNAPAGSADIGETMRPIVRQAMTQSEAPGLAIAVLRDGKTVYEASLGVLDFASKAPVTSDTRFHTASVTKTFVAVAVLQLVEQGKVDLDAHPRRYLPYYQLPDPRAEGMTVRQLLAHISGVPNDDDTRFDRPDLDDGALERFVREASSRPLHSAPGERFGYSNLGYCILGDLVAKVSGETF
jgi:CubicO group peptidase (beta-lactamase class C family)